jgi:hypothetical protein
MKMLRILGVPWSVNRAAFKGQTPASFGCKDRRKVVFEGR